MSMRKQVSLRLFSVLFVGLFFLATPESGYSGVPGAPMVGCCISDGSCVGCESGCAILEADCIADGGNIADLDVICVDQGAGATCQSPGGDQGCCVISQGDCLDEPIDISSCIREVFGIAWYDNPDCSQVPQCIPQPNIPTLGEWGLYALAGLLVLTGVIYYARRRRMTSI